MTNATGNAPSERTRVFLFLQGPHGPFFAQLAGHLRATGADCWRVAFNSGDDAGWPDEQSLLAFKGTQQDWDTQLENWINAKRATDVVLYGDSRWHHASAVRIARAHDLTIHIFEEGYLRPYWATYERNGSNGNSRLMDISLHEMSNALTMPSSQTLLPPDKWGDLRHHMVHGALYHWHVLFRNRAFENFRSHRDQSVREEFTLHLLRLLRRPRHILERWLATQRIRKGGWPYHVALLQLEHDASFRAFSPFTSQTEFVDVVTRGFAEGAPKHHHLIFKAHPLEDGRAPLADAIKHCAELYDILDRVTFVRGGKLAYVLDSARSAVTVNSTSAHQAFWRGLPVRCFGTSVYDKPGLVSHQPLATFFENPQRPDEDLYAVFRQFLLETSQVPGGFYSKKGRSQLLRNVVDMMLQDRDPYDLRLKRNGTKSQHLRLVEP